MGSEWPLRPLGDLCDQERGITYGIVKVGDFIPGGIPVIRGGDIRNGRIVFDGNKRVTEAVSLEFRRTILRGGELLVNLIAEPGHTAIVPPELAGANVSRDVGVIPLGDSVDHRYVDYFLKSPVAVQWLTARLQGSVTQKINLGVLRELPIPLPPLAEQERIAAALGALDDKIDLSRRMSQTLELTARALFKSWFIDFDPVRAKSEGRDPGLASQVANLFPSSFEDSELGEIPTGWRVAKIGSIADVIDCSHAKKPERRENGRPLLQLDNIRQDGVLDMADEYFISDSDYRAWTARIEASPGDCVITNVGRVGAVAQVPNGVRAALGRNMTAVRCRSDKPWPTFLIEALRSDSMRDEIVQRTDAGTILDALNVRSIPRLRVVEPSAPVLSRFEAAARPIRSKMELIEHEGRDLKGLRDAMLPSLLAGEPIGRIG